MLKKSCPRTSMIYYWWLWSLGLVLPCFCHALTMVLATLGRSRTWSYAMSASVTCRARRNVQHRLWSKNLRFGAVVCSALDKTKPRNAVKNEKRSAKMSATIRHLTHFNALPCRNHALQAYSTKAGGPLIVEAQLKRQQGNICAVDVPFGIRARSWNMSQTDQTSKSESEYSEKNWVLELTLSPDFGSKQDRKICSVI